MRTSDITDHYSLGGLRQRIEAALDASAEPPTVELLGAVDEFHVGGRAATVRLINALDLDGSSHVLDIGSGLGGTARLIASTRGASVTGIDLTEEYVAVASWLTAVVGLDDEVSFRTGSALDLPFAPKTFDAATMVHVGMNIADKAALFDGVRAALRPGGEFAIYDIMRVAEGELTYPVPWAASGETSALETSGSYASLLIEAGFEVVAVTDRTNAVAPVPATDPAAGPPPLGLHLVMGPDTGCKLSNMIANVRAGLIAPTEIIARTGDA